MKWKDLVASRNTRRIEHVIWDSHKEDSFEECVNETLETLQNNNLFVESIEFSTPILIDETEAIWRYSAYIIFSGIQKGNEERNEPSMSSDLIKDYEDDKCNA